MKGFKCKIICIVQIGFTLPEIVFGPLTKKQYVKYSIRVQY